MMPHGSVPSHHRDDQKVSTPWHKAKSPPTTPGIYIIYDGTCQRRVAYTPGYRWGFWRADGKRVEFDCAWHSLRGFPPIHPQPVKWREDDENWGI